MSLANNLSPSQSQSVIYTELLNQGIPDPLASLVVAQSGHETNGWISNVYLQNNNAFGYGWDGSSYTSYPSVEASADDIAGYLQRKSQSGIFPDLGTIATADQYAQLLSQAGYYTDTEANYAAGIKRWFSDNIAVIGISTGLILVIGIALWFLFK